VGSLGDGIIHPDLAPIHLYPIHLIPSLGGILNILVIDESKSTAATRVSIQHHLALLQVSELAELLLQLPLRGVQTQPKHPQALVRLGLLPVPMVSPPVRHGGARVTALLCSLMAP